MRKNTLLLLISTLLSANAVSAGISLNVTTTDATATALLQAEIDKQFQVPNMTNFLKSMSNAQSITSKGQGVSYATEHSLFVVGGGFGLGLSGDVASGFESKGGLPPVGLGAQGSFMAGLSLSKLPVPALGPIDLKRVTLFINYFGISNDSLVSSLSIKANTFGMHAQYKVIEGKNIGGIGILNWGGIAFTTGFNVSSNSLTYKVGQSITANSGSLSYTWTPNSNSTLALESNAFSIPFEISTSVRLLYVFSIFAGAGIDLNFGKSSVAANLNGPITGTGGVTGSASLTGTEEQGPTFGHLRFFAGPQLNLVPLKNTNLLSIYAQGNVSTGGNYGVHAGARIAW
ncbi:MAG: Lsa36 family surface (lipo)protein [Spirochaetota bacterium]